MKGIPETTWSDPSSIEYHEKQWLNPKASTLKFIEQIKSFVQPGSSVLDVGCGGGAATYEISKSFLSTHFEGVDFDPKLVEMASNASIRLQAPNLSFSVADIHNLEKSKFDGVISLQTLSWLPDYKLPMVQIAQNVSPEWIALTSLFYPGEITAITTIHEHVVNRSVNYNTYSLPRFSSFCESLGYQTIIAVPFVIDFDIPLPKDFNSMGTYTFTALEISQRVQISGPMLMNWMTVIMQKIK